MPTTKAFVRFFLCPPQGVDAAKPSVFILVQVALSYGALPIAGHVRHRSDHLLCFSIICLSARL